MISAIVYLLCALTSVLCALLLYHQYRKSRGRLLLWSSLCFFFLALNNILLFVDRVLTSDGLDLSVVRTIPAVLGFAVLTWGTLWDAR